MYIPQNFYIGRTEIESSPEENTALKKEADNLLMQINLCKSSYITLHFIPEKINSLYSQTLPDKAKLYTYSKKKGVQNK